MVNIRARLILSIRELAVHVPENLSRGSLNESFLIKVQYSYCNQLILMDQRNKRSGWTIGKAYRTIVKAKRDRKFGLAGRQMLRRVKSEISTRGDEYRCYLSTHCCIIFLSGERAIVGIVWSTCTRQYCMDRNEVIMSADLAIGIDPGAIRALTYNTWGDLSLYPRRMVMHVDIDVSRVYLESVLTQIDVGHVTRMQSYWVKGCIYIYYVIIEILSHGVSGDFLKRVGGMREQYAWEETPMHLQKDDVYWVARAVPDRLLLLGGGGGASRATDFSGIDARFVGQLIRDMVFYVVVSTKGTINNVCVPPVATSDLREYTFMCMLRRQSLRRGLYHTVRSDSDHSQSCDTREHMDCMFLLISMRWKAEEHVARVECVMLKSNKRVENIARQSTARFAGKGVINSGCSRHMTGNKSYLSDYEEIDGGFVAFGGDPKGCKITGKGKISTDKINFKDVYFVKELKFNLFSVSQTCDKKNSVLFTDTECVVLYLDFKLLDENHVLLRVPRKDNMYSVDLKNIVPPGGLTCLFAKATLDESNLWHMRLRHINFKTMNKLVRGNLVRGLPSKIFEIIIHVLLVRKESTIKPSCKPRHLKVKEIRCNNGTEFKNKVMNQFCEMKGIKREFSVARTSQQNGVAERKNRTLIEAARTMLADSKLPTTFWAEAVNTACYMALTKSMIYEPVVAGNQSNGSAGTKACDDAGKARMETVSGKEYILLPFLTQDSLFSSSSKEESRVNQEQDANVNITNNIDTVSQTVKAADIENNATDENIVYGCDDDPNMPNLE
ncbi:ribonuclease H-like domain-containing protein [Tanacetum coccineum]